MIEIISHFRIFKAALLILTSLSLFGCGSSSISNRNEINSILENQKFKSFLYSNSQASFEYFTNSNIPTDVAVAQNALIASGIDTSGYHINLIRIKYLNNNLPQYAIHITHSTNSKLVVYNHGHGGLPGPEEDFAKQFIKNLLDNGYDVLLTSMPLVGLNAINTNINYWATVYGQSNPAYFSNQLITPWVHFHSVYEIIDDKDHYMHFFIDPAVIFPSLVDKSSSSQFIDKLKVSGLPTKLYDETSYVGLSGGATTGLSACAVFSYKKCILVAGFLPFYLRASNLNSWGDAEQIKNHCILYSHMKK